MRDFTKCRCDCDAGTNSALISVQGTIIRIRIIGFPFSNSSVLDATPFQQKRKLRIFISNTFNPAKSDAEDGEGTVASWELRVEGRLLEDVSEG